MNPAGILFLVLSLAALPGVLIQVGCFIRRHSKRRSDHVCAKPPPLAHQGVLKRRPCDGTPPPGNRTCWLAQAVAKWERNIDRKRIRRNGR
jgi:hypothetical protein